MSELTALQERAAQLYVEGKTKSDAYRQAGYSVENMTDKSVNELASRLFSDIKVSSRVAELQEAHRQRHVFTVDDAVREYDEARQLAAQEKQAAPMISATKAKCELFGIEAPKRVNIEGTLVEWLASLQNASEK